VLEKIILAVDLFTEEEIKDLLNKLEPKPKVIKLGFQTILAIGLKRSLDLVKTYSPESQIFLDLKMHDIPNTVKSGVESLFLSILKNNSYNLRFLTLHTLGGFQMISDSQEFLGSLSVNLKPELVGVTLLTSHSLKELKLLFGIERAEETLNYIYKLIRFSKKAGINYFVCSPLEAKSIKEKFPAVKLICPGIRLAELSLKKRKEDQSRILDPVRALKFADFIVIGRPIYQAEDPQNNWKTLLSLVSPT